MEKTSVFIKIDEWIFNKLDLLKTEGVFQKFNDAISGLEDDKKKIIAQVITFSLILAPFIAVGILWWGNSQTRNAIDAKKQIIEQIAIFDGNQNTLNNVSMNYLAASSIQGQDDLDNRVRNILSNSQIDQQKVTVSNFRSTSTSSTIGKIEADLNFRDFGTNDFSQFLRSLVESEKFKVLKVNLTKNKETNLLSGTISLMHMGQNPQLQENI